MHQSLDTVGDPDEGAERNELGDHPAQDLAHCGLIKEGPDGLGLQCGLQCPQRQPGLVVRGVEPEELARDPLPDLDDVLSRVEAVPLQVRDRDEAHAGKHRMPRAIIQGDEHAERLNRRYDYGFIRLVED